MRRGPRHTSFGSCESPEPYTGCMSRENRASVSAISRAARARVRSVRAESWMARWSFFSIVLRTRRLRGMPATVGRRWGPARKGPEDDRMLALLLLIAAAPAERAKEVAARLPIARSAMREVHLAAAAISDQPLRAAVEAMVMAPWLPPESYAVAHPAAAERVLQKAGPPGGRPRRAR